MFFSPPRGRQKIKDRQINGLRLDSEYNCCLYYSESNRKPLIWRSGNRTNPVPKPRVKLSPEKTPLKISGKSQPYSH